MPEERRAGQLRSAITTKSKIFARLFLVWSSREKRINKWLKKTQFSILLLSLHKLMIFTQRKHPSGFHLKPNICTCNRSGGWKGVYHANKGAVKKIAPTATKKETFFFCGCWFHRPLRELRSTELTDPRIAWRHFEPVYSRLQLRWFFRASENRRSGSTLRWEYHVPTLSSRGRSRADNGSDPW